MLVQLEVCIGGTQIYASVNLKLLFPLQYDPTGTKAFVGDISCYRKQCNTRYI